MDWVVCRDKDGMVSASSVKTGSVGSRLIPESRPPDFLNLSSCFRRCSSSFSRALFTLTPTTLLTLPSIFLFRYPARPPSVDGM